MIALLAPLLLRIGIPARLHKAALVGAAVVALLAAFFIWLAFHDAGVRSDDRNKAAVVVGKKVIKAERAANANDAARQAEIQANDAATRKAIQDAEAKNPEAARAPAGPAARAAADSLRARQASPGPAPRRTH